jgi:EamA domain-containing membrane protein RarD
MGFLDGGIWGKGGHLWGGCPSFLSNVASYGMLDCLAAQRVVFRACFEVAVWVWCSGWLKVATYGVAVGWRL